MPSIVEICEFQAKKSQETAKSTERMSNLSDFDDEALVKLMGVRSLKENFDKQLQAQHPSLAKTKLTVAELLHSKDKMVYQQKLQVYEE